MELKKTYRAIRHDVVRLKQSENCNSVHHPDEKINQIQKVFKELDYNIDGDLKILEFFAGNGNLTNIYRLYGSVIAYEKNKERFKELEKNTQWKMTQNINECSYLAYHEFIYNKYKFNVIDLDPYGFPNRFFPDIFLLIENGVMFITMPKPYVNILNGITQTHLISYYGEHNPSMDVIVDRIALWGLCHWRKVELIDYIDCKSIWRFAFKVDKVKATEYTDVKNR